MFRKLATQQKLTQAVSSMRISSASVDSSSMADIEHPPRIERNRAPGLYWQNRMDAHIKFHKKREANEHTALQVRPRDAVYMDPLSTTGCQGDARLKKLNESFTHTHLRRGGARMRYGAHMSR
jgi:hypothetical protein